MKNRWLLAGVFLCAFIGWTVALTVVDVQGIGPNGTSVGFACINGWFHNLTGVHFSLYLITDWMGLVPVMVALGFAVLGMVQWIRRKKLRYVDADILILGLFYVVVIGVYLLFESVVINYRPVLIERYLEVSYPSSTTLLVLCVMPTAWLQLQRRMRCWVLKRSATMVVGAFVIFMVMGRLISGVHWFTDIVGGLLLSGGLVLLYDAAIRRIYH